MTSLTVSHRELADHIRFNGGSKTVCVSTCLSFFGIRANTYHYTSSKSNLYAYEDVLRRNGFSVRSRQSEFKVKENITTLTELKSRVKKSKYTANDLFIVYLVQSTKAHLIVINGEGETLIDTSNGRWRVGCISIVENK
jgi:hypothetical protein